MNKNEWLKNNKGNNCGQDFDRQFLLDIYDRIAAERIKLKDEENENDKNITSNKDNNKDETYRKRFDLDENEIIIKGNLLIIKYIY